MFEVGANVKCINADGSGKPPQLEEDKTYKVRYSNPSFVWLEGINPGWYPSRFIPVTNTGNDPRGIPIDNICGHAKSALDTQVGGEHYKTKGIQPVEYIHANRLDFFEGNIVKYITRWRDKGGVKDLEKVIHYAQMLIELEGKDNV